jgi:hypothetical protein
VVTALAVAVKAALEAPAATVTDAGTVTALLLLARLTRVPTVTGPVSVTVHASVTDPVSDPPVQETPLTVGGACPVPLNVIVAVLGALLLISTVPLTAPDNAGSNPTVSTAVCPGSSVMGALTPDTENPAPEAVAPLRIRSAVPVDVTVTVLLIAVFSESVPNARLVALRLSPAFTAFSCNGYVAEAPPAVAVSVAVCAVLTAVAVAVNPALEAPAAMVTEAGTVTAPLLLARPTTVALVTADEKLTVHASVPAPDSAALLQDTPLSVAGDCPVPLSAIVAALEALLLIVTIPLAGPVTAGSNPMVNVAVCP